MNNEQVKGKLLFLRAYEKTLEKQRLQEAIKQLYMKRFRFIPEEADCLEMVFLPRIIFSKLTENQVWQCIQLHDLMYPPGVKPAQGLIFHLHEFVESRKESGFRDDPFDRYLEQVYKDKLWSRRWQNKYPSDFLIELLPFDQQVEFLSALKYIAKYA